MQLPFFSLLNLAVGGNSHSPARRDCIVSVRLVVEIPGGEVGSLSRPPHQTVYYLRTRFGLRTDLPIVPVHHNVGTQQAQVGTVVQRCLRHDQVDVLDSRDKALAVSPCFSVGLRL